MAEFLYATSHLAGDFPNPGNAVGNTPGTWAGDLNTNANYTSRWAIGDPVDPLTGSATQTIRVVARKGSNSGTPTIALNLYENGVLVQAILAATNVTSTTGQTLTGTFNTSAVTNPADVEIEVVQTGAGGNPNTRNSAQISHIEWEADTAAASIEGDGDFNAPAATVAGAGTVPVEADGSFNPPITTVAGAGDVLVDADGTFTALAPQVSGTGSTTSDINADGDFTAPSATVAGAGDVPIAADGGFTASAPAIAGAGDVPVEADGNTTSPTPTYAGLGVVAISGDGAALAPISVVAGAGTVESGAVEGDGTYIVPAVVLTGGGGVEIAASGSFLAPASSVVGVGGSGIISRRREGYSASRSGTELTPLTTPGKEARKT